MIYQDDVIKRAPAEPQTVKNKHDGSMTCVKCIRLGKLSLLIVPHRSDGFVCRHILSPPPERKLQWTFNLHASFTVWFICQVCSHCNTNFNFWWFPLHLFAQIENVHKNRWMATHSMRSVRMSRVTDTFWTVSVLTGISKSNCVSCQMMYEWQVVHNSTKKSCP